MSNFNNNSLQSIYRGNDGSYGGDSREHIYYNLAIENPFDGVDNGNTSKTERL